MLDSSLASIENWYSYVKTKNSRNQKFNQLTSQYTVFFYKNTIYWQSKSKLFFDNLIHNVIPVKL